MAELRGSLHRNYCRSRQNNNQIFSKLSMKTSGQYAFGRRDTSLGYFATVANDPAVSEKSFNQLKDKSCFKSPKFWFTVLRHCGDLQQVDNSNYEWT